MSPASPSNSAATALPVRDLNAKIKGWIDRLGAVWVEGELAQINMKPQWKFSYLTLRDPETEASVKLLCPSHILRSVAVSEGSRVVVLGKPTFYEKRGDLSLLVTEIRQVGIGELLARIEQLRRQLQAEGLFDVSRKKRPPVLPQCIGLITGRGSAAERDVLSVATDRWPQVNFRVRNTAVQGARAVPEIIPALQALDADPEVDVIIIARGGGSVEDLLPFSEEALQRAVAACSTPVVSAIGHEPDNPVLDNVADVRAATPTDAAKRIVPDAAVERAGIVDHRQRGMAALRGWVDREQKMLADVRSRPVLADPLVQVRREEELIAQAKASIRRTIGAVLEKHTDFIASQRAQVASLGPAATLGRGYAIVQVVPRDGSEPEVVTAVEMSPPGSQLRIRVSDGSITAAAMAATKAD